MASRQVYHCSDCNTCIACGKRENPHKTKSIITENIRSAGEMTFNKKYILVHDMNDNWKLKLKYYDDIIYGVENVSKGLYELDMNNAYVLKKEFHMLNERSFPTILSYNYFNYK